MARFIYSQAQKNFLESGYKENRIPELTVLFNEQFGLEKTASQIRCCIKNNNFSSGGRGSLKKGERSSYTKEMLGFLAVNYPDMDRNKLAKAFNKEFGLEKTPSAIVGVCKRYQLKSGRDGKFQKGHVPSPKCYPTKPNSGSFKKGNKPWNWKPVGSERTTKDGSIMIKVSEPNKYRLKRRVVYEQHFGEIPKGHVVVCRDGNSGNCSPENLTLMTNSELSYLNQSGHKHAHKEIQPVLRTMARLQSKQHTIEKEGHKSGIR